ncbi:MAG TPA: hypothetical protein VFR23_18050 [Jiangellaceae bacterium]|nr:hypothetical protein [Jiangellaceae bacterium]
MHTGDKKASEPAVDRRALLRRGGGILAGVAGIGALNAAIATPASGDPGQPVLQGFDNNAQTTKTTLRSSNVDATYEVVNSGTGAPVRLGTQPLSIVSGAEPGDLHNLDGDLHYTHIAGFPSLVYSDFTANMFVPITPARAVDTRTAGGRSRIINPSSLDAQGRLRGGQTMRVNLADFVFFGLAIYGNVTVTQPTAAGFVTMFPMGTRPPTSTVNFVTGQTVANFAVCGIGFDATFDDFVSIFASQTTHVILDITGLSVFHPGQVSQPLSAEGVSGLDAAEARRSRAEGAAEKLREMKTR